jgi:hypothetical protein
MAAYSIAPTKGWHQTVNSYLQGKPRAPKSSHLWISGLVYCWKCGKRMAGWTKDGGHRTYCCSSYRTYGKHNQYGCELNRVRHDVLEHYIDLYLQDTGQAIETVLTASEEDLPEIEDQEADARRVAYLKAFTRCGGPCAGQARLPRLASPGHCPPWSGSTRKKLVPTSSQLSKRSWPPSLRRWTAWWSSSLP